MIASPRTLSALVAVFTALAADHVQAAQARGSEAPPTPLEQALIDHGCRAGAPTAPSSDEAYQSCLAQQLQTLRANFGGDLNRLTGADRRTVDARCTPLQASRGHDAYVSCLNRELAALLQRRGRRVARAAVSPTPPVSSESAIDSPAAPIEPVVEAAAEPLPAPQDRRLWMAALAVGCGLVGFGWLRLGRPRETAGHCRQCGAARPGPGDLCTDCRHHAAASLRRSAPESAADAHSPAGGVSVDGIPAVSAAPPRPLVAMPDDLARAERARLDEEARARAEAERTEEVRRAERAEAKRAEAKRAEAKRAENDARREEVRRSEARRRRDEEIVQLSTASDAPPDVFNPYLVLGVARGATLDAIEAAYAAARQKYAPDQVEHLGAELRDHFKGKALAADRAYQLLSGPQAPATLLQ